MKIKSIQNEINIFELELQKIICSHDNFLKDDLKNFMFSNQKRLRPIFVFLFSKILNVKSLLVLRIALIVELLHSATLIHDDIIDEEKIRRLNPTFYAKYGSKLAVLEGDLLLSMAFNILSETNLEILKIFSKKINLTITGEIEQNSNLNKITSFDDYIEKTKNKTANLFLAGLEALFTLSEQNENLEKFMLNYSIAFQIKNDIKDIQSDFKNGNYTLVMLYFLMENNLQDLKNQNLDKYILKAKNKLNEYKFNAIKNLEDIKNSKYKDDILKICENTLGSEI